MKLRDFVIDQAVLPQLAAPTRDEALEEMLDALIAADAVDADLRTPLFDLLLAREKNGSTGFGKGVAVPHVKHPGVKTMCAAVAISGPGVDFNALDKQPVYTLFMLVSPAGKPDQHLQAMETLVLEPAEGPVPQLPAAGRHRPRRDRPAGRGRPRRAGLTPPLGRPA